MNAVPEWVVPGQPVSVESRYEKTGRGTVRTWTVSRVGSRYIIVTDAMGNEQKFQTSTLTCPGTRGRVEVLVPPDRNLLE